jgi:hypothetical protein
MARMSIDDSVTRDPRVLRGARALGLSRREMIGTLIDVWAIAYDRATPFLPREDIDTAAELDGFAAVLERVGLARAEPEGVRLAGVEERIDYLKKQAERGSKGGQVSAENRKRGHEKQAYASSAAQAPSAERSSLSPDLVPDPVPDLQIATLPRAPDPRTPDTEQPAPAPVPRLAAGTQVREPVRDDAPAPVLPIRPGYDRQAQVEFDAWRYHVELFATLQHEGIDTNARPPHAIAMGKGEADLRKRVNEMREKSMSYDAIAERLRHRLDVGAAEARRDTSLKHFSATAVWSSGSFWVAEGMSVEQASTPRRTPARASPDEVLGPSKPHADHPISEGILRF